MSDADFKKRALLAIETLRSRVSELEGAAREPIAIIGYAGRFPGSPDAEAFWELLREGRDGISPIPPDRWDADAFYDADPEAAGKMSTRRAGFVDDVANFDAQFFGISPREADYMDPQHRMLLETTWHALEHACLAATSLAGTRTGVFMGLSTHDYLGLLTGKLSYGAIEAYFGTGTSPAAGTGRISYRFGFEGPAVTVDTACSSSLVAIHQACHALRSGESDLALVGGVNALLTPATMINFSRARMLAPDGRCKTFDAGADGYVRAEGCGVIVLKRLSDAERDGDRIRAVIRGSAVDQDGASGGLTVPNGRAQQRVIRDALQQAGVQPAEVDYLEAHGTGTSLGDPIEVQAAAAVLGAEGLRPQPLWMGSVKTNIGHLEAAAGIASVIKVVLSLEHGLLPRHLHFKTPSPHIPWDRLNVRVLRDAQPWPKNGTPRRAGVSSFGFSGTNAHVVIEEAPSAPPAAPRPAASGPDEAMPVLLPIAARTSAALHAVATEYATWLDAHPAVPLADVAYTAGVGRSHLEHRAGMVVETRERAAALLRAVAEERPVPGVVTGVSADPPKTAWLFTGQGSQYAGMAQDLYATQPVVRETLDHCAAVLKDVLPIPLLSVMFDAAQPLGNTAYAQPALFALEMSLARLWQHWGLTPDVVLGHSVGQYAAACVAGVFSLDEGLRLLAERGRLFAALPAGGRMAAIFGDAAGIEARVAASPALSVAAYNGAHTVISGGGADVEALVEACRQAGMRADYLETSHAFHSALLEPALDAFEAAARAVAVQPVARTLICNRTGKVLSGQTVLDAAYWRRHARQPVQFAESIQTLASLGCKVLVEIGPQPVLTATVLRGWPEGRETPTAIASLRREVVDRRQIVEAAAQLYVAGSRLDFQAITGPGRTKVDLPAYPFQRRRFWPKTERGRREQHAHGLLGSRRDLASGDVVYATRFSVKDQPWLTDHVIYGTVVVPGATYAAMAMHAAGVPAELQEVFFYEPILFTGNESREVQLTLHAPEDAAPGTRRFDVHSRPYGDRDALWSLNSTGRVVIDSVAPRLALEESLDAIVERLSPVRPQQLFDGFAQNDLKWGPTWCTCLTSLRAGNAEAVGEITIGADLDAHVQDEPLHPVLLDLCTGVAGASLLAMDSGNDEEMTLFLPLKYDGVTLSERAPKRFYCYAKWQNPDNTQSETQAFDLHFLSTDGRHIGGIRNFVVKRAPRQALLRALGADAGRLLYRLAWRELPIAAQAAEAAASGTWLLVGPDYESTKLLSNELHAAGQRALTIEAANAWQVIDETRVGLDPSRADEWQSLFSYLSERDERPLGIVWLAAGWEGPSHRDEAESTEHLIARLEQGLVGAIGAAQHLVSLERSPLPRGLAIVTEHAVAAEPSEDVDPVHAAFWGLGRTLASEQPVIRCTLIDHDGTADALRLLRDVLVGGAAEPELALRQRKTLVPRLMPWARSDQLVIPSGQDYRLEPSERGMIDNLGVRPSEIQPPSFGYVQVRPEAAGLNFRDVLNVLGLYPGDPGAIGGELAGVVCAIGEGVDEFQVGQRVFGFAPGGAFASRVNVPFLFLASQPARLSPVDAATLPAAVLTATLAFEYAKPRQGERVLIHAASGGVGLAAVQLAQRAGAIVFATASKPKQKTLRELGVQHIYDSRSTSFADEILADTDGAGVDVVLNSLTNEGFVESTVRATAANGRFVEIAKRDIWPQEKMAAHRPDIRYHILALDEIMEHDPVRIKRLLTDLAAQVEQRALDPLPYQAYPLTEAKAAFRCMQQARHIGKIVLCMPAPMVLARDRSYLITGGLGALGVRTAAFFAQMGAGHLVLASRRVPDMETQRLIDEIAAKFNCQIRVALADVGSEHAVAELLAEIRGALPPLAGVAHLAGVLDDALIPQQSADKVRTVLAPKAFGAWHLHRLTRNDALDFFLLYSSASSVLGSPGQANYASANAFLDGLAAHRRARGRPAACINWGPWAEAGMAASDAARANLGKQGLIPLKPTVALSALSEMVNRGAVQATVINANWQRAAKLFGPMRPPILEHVLPKAAAATAGDQAFLRQLQQVPAPQRGLFLTEHLQRELQQLLGLAQPPGPDSKFLELGMDSLMAVELRNRMLGQFGTAFTISSTVVFDYPTIRGLAEYLAGQTPEPAAAPAPPPTGIAPPDPKPTPQAETLQGAVADLIEKLKPFRKIGVTLQIGGVSIPVDGDAETIEQAILQEHMTETPAEIA